MNQIFGICRSELVSPKLMTSSIGRHMCQVNRHSTTTASTADSRVSAVRHAGSQPSIMSTAMFAPRANTPGAAKNTATPSASSTSSVAPRIGWLTSLRRITSLVVIIIITSSASTATPSRQYTAARVALWRFIACPWTKKYRPPQLVWGGRHGCRPTRRASRPEAPRGFRVLLGQGFHHAVDRARRHAFGFHRLEGRFGDVEADLAHLVVFGLG